MIQAAILPATFANDLEKPWRCRYSTGTTITLAFFAIRETTMPYLREAWYLAAWAEEIKPGELFHRTLLDEPVVFYRLRSGAIAALHDRCPHRFVPLHLGKLENDIIQ